MKNSKGSSNAALTSKANKAAGSSKAKRINDINNTNAQRWRQLERKK